VASRFLNYIFPRGLFSFRWNYHKGAVI
jgi:hypothetical protein